MRAKEPIHLVNEPGLFVRFPYERVVDALPVMIPPVGSRKDRVDRRS